MIDYPTHSRSTDPGPPAGWLDGVGPDLATGSPVGVVVR